jgi:hypothetical protein
MASPLNTGRHPPSIPRNKISTYSRKHCHKLQARLYRPISSIPRNNTPYIFLLVIIRCPAGVPVVRLLHTHSGGPVITAVSHIRETPPLVSPISSILRNNGSILPYRHTDRTTSTCIYEHRHGTAAMDIAQSPSSRAKPLHPPEHTCAVHHRAADNSRPPPSHFWAVASCPHSTPSSTYMCVQPNCAEPGSWFAMRRACPSLVLRC